MSLRATLAPALRPRARPSSSSAPSRRLASNTATRTAPLTVEEATAARQLDWPTYLALRRSQRLYGLIASIPTTLIGFSAGAGYFATIEADPTNTILGFEPVVIYGAATLGCVGLGWLAGPTVGGAIWRLTHRNVGKAMEAKDKDFFRHISRWRADPSRQSAANPSPDYYAEKVGSLRQYRTWLRDQAAFKRKAQFGQGSDAVY
ncbi:TIM23 complex component [Rhodotorula kratochvilovae]